MKQNLQLQQKQSVKLTPQLQMAIKLLQYSRMELQQEIERAVESNPFLEIVDQQNQAEHRTPELEPVTHSLAEFTESTLDTARPAPIDEDFNILEHIAQTGTLSSHLLEQLRLSSVSTRDFVIGEAIIDSLNEDGYFLCSWQDIQLACPLNPQVTDSEIETVLQVIQQFEPVGVASRTLSECLVIQLQQLELEPKIQQIAEMIATHHLDQLAQCGLAGVVKILNEKSELVAQAVSTLKTLDPKPGAAFNAPIVQYVEPDYWLENVRGNWKIHALKPQSLRINSFYQSLIKQSRGNDSVYMKQHLQEASWLIKSIQARQDTLKRVLKAIIKKQQAFLEQGPKAIQALTLKDIAEQIGMHESTVSRACQNKYLRTTYGTFELRTFFSAGVGSESGNIQASGAVQAWIRELVAQEDPAKPLSDSQLVNALQRNGMTVARRTVAKYRESLNIQASYLRQK